VNSIVQDGGAGARSGSAASPKNVALSFPDVNGVLRGKAFTARAFDDLCQRNGAAFTNLLLALDPLDNPITSFRDFGIASGAADLIVRPDRTTLRSLPWNGDGLCFGDLYWSDGRVCELSARGMLARILARLETLGYKAFSAFEFEVRVFTDRNGTPATDGLSYSVSALSPITAFLDEVRDAADALALGLTAVHTEGAPGLLEINLDPQVGIAAADTAILLRLLLKEVARRHGLHVSLLAKPVDGEEGSSGHLHCSLLNAAGANAFSDGDGLGLLQRQAIAGVVKHLPAMSLLYNPTINSYKRLVPGFFAPVNAAWGIDNRSAALRAILPEQANARRIELRRPGADVNPYLALSGLLASICLGIEGRLEPPPALGRVDAASVAGSIQLPCSLEEAIGTFERDPVAREALGPAFCDYFVATRRWELLAWQQAVSAWERERYVQIC
jgi:glutamine synthetase